MYNNTVRYDNAVSNNTVRSNTTRYDNKIRLSRDVLEKAETIAAEWGLKNVRAAVEAVFRRYADEYRFGRNHVSSLHNLDLQGAIGSHQPPINPPAPTLASCEALNELDELLSL